MREMTYAKRKAARPATAATTIEPWTLDADPVNWVGEAVALGAVTLCGAEMEPVDDGTDLVVGATLFECQIIVLPRRLMDLLTSRWSR